MKTINSTIFENIFATLPQIAEHHAPTDPLHKLIKEVAHKEAETLFSAQQTAPVNFGQFGPIRFPYFQMGSTSSINLFDMDELIIFSYYWLRRKQYRNVADIGANIGLHTLILSKCGYKVRAYEPDKEHVKRINKHIQLNKCTNVDVFEQAVSSNNGKMEFIRVLGNTTGSHLAGAKTNPYGELKKVQVDVQSIVPIMEWADLVKMDVEGHEKTILPAVPADLWKKTDMLVEIGSVDNAKIVFAYLKKNNINMFVQKNNWSKATAVRDIPTSYKEGTLFITTKKSIDWQ